MKVMVIGATGHLGANIAIDLVNNSFSVVAVGRRNSDNGFFADNGIEYIGGFDLGLVQSYDRLPTDIDAIVHMAGTMPAHSDLSPLPYIQSIVVGMVNLCEWARNTPCKRIVFNTTPADVGHLFDAGVPVPDDAVRSFPKDGGDHSIYAIAKTAASDILQHYLHAYGISYIVFRHLTVYGYHPNPYYNVNGVKKMSPWRQIIKNASETGVVEVWGNPGRFKELLYMADFTRAVRLALGHPDVNGIYNLGGYEHYTLDSQIRTIAKVFSPINVEPRIIYRPEKADCAQSILDNSKAERDLGWTPEYTWEAACLQIKQDLAGLPFRQLWGVPADYE